MTDVLYFDADEAIAAVVTLKKFGLDAYTISHRVEPPGEPPYFEWLVRAPELRTFDAAERDEAEDYIDSEWDRRAEDRMIRDGYKRDGSMYDY